MTRYVIQDVIDFSEIKVSSHERWEDVVSAVVAKYETMRALIEHNMKAVKKLVEKYGSGLLDSCSLFGYYDPYNGYSECIVITDTQFKFSGQTEKFKGVFLEDETLEHV